ncbi:ABC transporter substrate-binding protein [Paenibacillus athensensis]|uniref:Aliphatic sulfonate ABC transporter substrate-binding protein n=1 Tax=Paenibacillus athensensis TaxID=1967502 RepID=A0A4Y8Q571_9BACL|nr:ABC transporter substrate-binding protein [Paenibacillus athensensis]MCD1259596.1 ABC transporter substrate-binding protein [Paenibacillus athensensis]
MRKIAWMLALMLLASGLLTACGSAVPEGSKAHKVRLGVFKNVTHAAAYIALQKGYFQQLWGDDVDIEVTAFDNGSDLSIAMATGDIDIGFVGPGPATTFYLKSRNFRIVSGSNNGGAVLVARSDAGIASVKDLADKTIAIPSKGNTNEISLRLLLAQAGIGVGKKQGEAHLIVRAPADTLISFRQKEADATLVPEPWGTQLEKAGLGRIVVDWQGIPPYDGHYPTVIMVASDTFIERQRELVKGAIQANRQAIDFIHAHPDEAYDLINSQLKKLSGKGMDKALIRASINRLDLTTSVSREAVEQMAKVSIDARYIKGVKKEELNLSDFFDLSMLQELESEKP